jgi:hypothetical protein
MTRYRVGRKVGRTIYRQLGDEPSDDDTLVGVMDNRPMAMAAVLGLNAMQQAADDHGIGHYWAGLDELAEELG